MWSDYHYLINRFPLPSLKYQTPHERLCKQQPSYAHLKSFGCLCYPSTVKPGSSKFEPRSRPCIFIGYPFEKKAYKLYDIQSQTVFASRDVVFHEKCYPFHHTILPTTLPLPTIPNEFPISLYYPLTDPSPAPCIDVNGSQFQHHDHQVSPIDHSTTTTNTMSPYHSSHTRHTQVTSTHSLKPQAHNPATLRRSIRIHSAPVHLKDYVCYGVYCLNDVDPSLNASSSMSFVASILNITEPRTYKQASKDPNFMTTMDSEIKALDANGTWEIMPMEHIICYFL
ncbi:hypothetical protein LIER_00561 [Lithospermum erythrorhizon]|uniref:Retroviral polymerase SH3-like domain-containing protein n=1 Tax=Lithospermum erythrorhizon TaxID=34254 RepID=A0AAV3NKB8_LITER